MLARPDEYMRLAKAAEKWTAEQEAALFPTSDTDLSLSGFFKVYYRQNCIADAKSNTIHQYEVCVRLWQRITGDPPLRLVTNTVICKFRDTLLRMTGRFGKPYSVNTVASKLTQIQAILDAAGPPRPHHRDAAGILTQVPYAKPPRKRFKTPTIVTVEQLELVYEAASKMEMPNSSGILPVKWWRALLSVAINTALRRGSLFALQWQWVDFKNHKLVIPADAMKRNRPHVVPLNADALAHLESIRRKSGLVFPWPYSKEWFSQCFKTLQEHAGIKPADWFGLHALRRTAATLLWKHCPEAAQIVLGHRSSLITLQHYVEPAEAATAGLDKLTAPWAEQAHGRSAADVLPEPIIRRA